MPARALRIPLRGSVSAAEAGLLLRSDERPFVLSGDWAGGAALLGSEPVAVAHEEEDPFALLDRQPAVADGGDAIVGGGWFGYLGYTLGARLERVPKGPRGPFPLPGSPWPSTTTSCASTPQGQWWFEALWTDERDAALRARLELLRTRLAKGTERQPTEWAASRRWRRAPRVTKPPWPRAASESPPARSSRPTSACAWRPASRETRSICSRAPRPLWSRAAPRWWPGHGARCAAPRPSCSCAAAAASVLTEPIKGTAPRLAADPPGDVR